MEMNVGVLLQEFDLPDWPKVITDKQSRPRKKDMMFNVTYKTLSLRMPNY